MRPAASSMTAPSYWRSARCASPRPAAWPRQACTARMHDIFLSCPKRSLLACPILLLILHSVPLSLFFSFISFPILLFILFCLLAPRWEARAAVAGRAAECPRGAHRAVREAPTRRASIASCPRREPRFSRLHVSLGFLLLFCFLVFS